MVSDGVLTVDPEYLLPKVTVVDTPLTIFCQYTVVCVGLAVTVQVKVIDPP